MSSLSLLEFSAIVDMLADLVGRVFEFLAWEPIAGVPLLHILVGLEFLRITAGFVSQMRTPGTSGARGDDKND